MVINTCNKDSVILLTEGTVRSFQVFLWFLSPQIFFLFLINVRCSSLLVWCLLPEWKIPGELFLFLIFCLWSPQCLVKGSRLQNAKSPLRKHPLSKQYGYSKDMLLNQGASQTVCSSIQNLDQSRISKYESKKVVCLLVYFSYEKVKTSLEGKSGWLV